MSNEAGFSCYSTSMPLMSVMLHRRVDQGSLLMVRRTFLPSPSAANISYRERGGGGGEEREMGREDAR